MAETLAYHNENMIQLAQQCVLDEEDVYWLSFGQQWLVLGGNESV